MGAYFRGTYIRVVRYVAKPQHRSFVLKKIQPSTSKTLDLPRNVATTLGDNIASRTASSLRSCRSQQFGVIGLSIKTSSY